MIRLLRDRLRRFAAVGIAVTAVDIAVLIGLRLSTGMPVILADAIAVGVASTLAYVLHSVVTFADDPHRRWTEHTTAFVVIAIVAGLVDIVVLRLAVAVLGSTSGPPLFVAKCISVAVASIVRVRGYRVLLRSDVRAAQVRREDREPAPGSCRLSVVVPAYQEEGRIASVIDEIRDALAAVAADGALEIVVVDDGSSDATADTARKGGADQVIVQPENRGKGAAVRAGVLAAHGRTIAFTDADLSYPPEQLLGLLAGVEGGWDMVVGSRKHIETTTLLRARRLRELSGRLFNALSQLVLLGQYKDTQCGLKAFRSDVGRFVFSRSRVDRFAFDVELLHLAERYRLSVAEVPVTVANRTTSTVRIANDSVRMVTDLIRIRRWSGMGVYDPDPYESPHLEGAHTT
ncbi:MAG TPA: glycosyltransferase [Acidimicrobiales bacterium]